MSGASNSDNAAAVSESLRQAVHSAHQRLVRELWREAVAPDGPWRGRLSTSALSTATAVSALSLVVHSQGVDTADAQHPSLRQLVDGGCRWLETHQNDDGGFGDTDRSHSNIATTLLVLAAWRLANWLGDDAQPVRRAWRYVEQAGGWDALRARYGRDKTFVVPILSNCALAGLREWEQVPPLPFEAAWLPQSWYRLARLPVVSYAVPALVAIGQLRFHFCPPQNPLLRIIRQRAIEPTLKVLERMQPDSGGYLEAVPLTSFVLMSLVAVGRGDLAVARNAQRFLVDSVLPDGSWPIDTDLATWVTNLSVAALQRRSGCVGVIRHRVAEAESINVTTKQQINVAADAAVASDATGNSSRPPDADSTGGSTGDEGAAKVNESLVRWILSCQHRRRHPFTGADPGGWGWTDLSGAVPDADDTPAALLALSYLDLTQLPGELHRELAGAVTAGLNWLLGLQNRDGGWPTFCRGWGKLPFDRSGTDLTAHAIRACQAWMGRLDWLGETAEIDKGNRGVPARHALQRAIDRGFSFLARTQQPDGSWLPLWFGNQDHPDEANPVYGTSKVLMAYAECNRTDTATAQKAIQWLQAAQNTDGGWGGGPSTPYRVAATPETGIPPASVQAGTDVGSSVEETAVALEALIATGASPFHEEIVMRGLRWLATAIEAGHHRCPWPIGLYFAKLWYHEKLYPIVFSVAALGAALHVDDRNQDNRSGFTNLQGNSAEVPRDH